MSDSPEYSKKYVLTWRLKPLGNVIGGVRNYRHDDKRYREIVISHDDVLLEISMMRFAAIHYVKRFPVIVVSKHLLALDRLSREACIWHEVGHVHHHHRQISRDLPGSTVRERRVSAINSGTVVPEEIEADDFAVLHVGADAVISFLRQMLSTRPVSASDSPVKFNDLGRTELERRIERLQNR